jgi:tRNA A-37 threonylcarbamoyl transferase component Bud32
MKKSKTLKVQDSPQIKKDNKSQLNEIDKKLILKTVSFKKDDNKKSLNTKANTTITDSSKEDKKESTIKKKKSKDKDKFKKQNISVSSKEKVKNKAFDNSDIFYQKKEKKEIKKNKKKKKNSKKKLLKNSLSQRNIGKMKYNDSKTCFDNKISNTVNSSLNRADSSHNILLGTENFVKSLLSKYMDGSDDILNEDLEAFNNNENNEDYEQYSFLEDNIENTTIREPLTLKKNLLSREEKKNATICFSVNSKKYSDNEKMKKKIDKKQSNQITTNKYNSYLNSPTRISSGRFSMYSKIKPKASNAKTIVNSPRQRNSLTKPKIKKNEKSKKNDESKESKLARKISYSKKIMNSFNKCKQNKNNENVQKNNNNKEAFSMSKTIYNLDVIFENKNTYNDTIAHHYLINTVSTKNKMVQKKNKNSFEQNRNTLNTFNRISNVLYDNNNKNNIPFKKTLSRLNRTPKVQKDYRVEERFSLNNNNSTRNYFRKSSFAYGDLSLENNISGISTNNNIKIFNGKIEDYLITKELGKGSYAVVKLAMHKKNKNKYAIKIYTKKTLLDPQKRNTVKNETNILKQIDNENVMKLYEVIDTPSNLYLVLEYINGINLLEILKNEKYHYIKEQRAKKLFLQIVNGISYCHKKNIFHRDIKLENILVLKDDTIKIIDFGFAVKCNKESFQKLFCGTPSYMPPEILKKEKYIACYSEIWSLGVLFYTMLFGIFPFKGKDEDELLKSINETKLEFPEYNQIEDKTKELFKKIFIINPNERISMDDMINILKE